MSEPSFQHIRCRPDETVLVITIAEKQMQGDELADALRQEFFKAQEQFQLSRIVLDFQQVKYLGSAGFRPLLSLYRRLREQGGSMMLCNLSPEVEEVFRVTRLITTAGSTTAPFEAAPNLDEAIKLLKSR
jgi:anti-anti-sigma factor